MILPKCCYHGGSLPGPPVLVSLSFLKNKSSGLDAQSRYFGAQKINYLTAAFFLFCRQADQVHIIKADNPLIIIRNCRLCVYASGSLLRIVICNCLTEISVSCLHFGQNNGKFSRTESFRIFTRVLLQQTGQTNQLVSVYFLSHTTQSFS